MEYLFRGLTKTGRWVYGYLYKHFSVNPIKETCVIFEEEGDIAFTHRHDVLPKTVGLLIEQTDKNGVKIFEGDLLKTFDGEVGEVRLETPFCTWGIQNERHFRSFENIYISAGLTMGNLQPLIEVIGNIHQEERDGKGN
jgi:hypothetical protein